MSSTNKFVRFFGASVVFIGTPAASWAQAYYSITDLGTASPSGVAARGLSSNGKVAGDASLAGTSRPLQHGYLWIPSTNNGSAGSLIDINPSGSTSAVTSNIVTGSLDSQSYAVNAGGVVVGQFETEQLKRHAFAWSTGTMQDLGTLGGNTSFAYGVNDSGTVVGAAQTTLGFSQSQAFRWTAGTMINLGTLVPDPQNAGKFLGNSSALAVNKWGVITGFSINGTAHDSDFHACTWQNGKITDLGTAGGRYSVGRAINANGTVAGQSMVATNPEEKDAVTWKSGTVIDLRPLGSYFSDGLGINDGEQVVGTAELADGSYSAFIATGGAAVDLNTEISPTSGWRLCSANAINNSGQIVGWAKIGGAIHAFLLTPVSRPAISSISPSTVTVGSGSFSLMVSGTGFQPGAKLAVGGDLLAPTTSTSTSLGVTVPAADVAVAGTPCVSVVNPLPYGSATSSILVVAPQVASISVVPGAVVGGNGAVGTVTLTQPAAGDGAVVTLTSGYSQYAAMPATVTVPAGSKSMTFAVTTHPVPAAKSIALSAKLGATKTTSIKVILPTLASVVLAPTSVVGGSNATGTITLNGSSIINRTFSLKSGYSAVAYVPATTTLTGGTTTKFTIQTHPVTTPTAVTIAVTDDTGVVRSTKLTVVPASFTSVSVDPTAVSGGGTSTATIALNGISPGGRTFSVKSGYSAIAFVPSSVSLEGGSSKATFTIGTHYVSTTTKVTITVSDENNVIHTTQITVNP